MKNFDCLVSVFDNDFLISSGFEENSIKIFEKTIKNHSRQVAVIACKMGYEIGLSEADINIIYLMGLLHDIGKIDINESILNKKGPLTKREWIKVKKHFEIGYKILKKCNIHEEVSLGVRYHHERFDGKGYPLGLKAKEIPLFSRIISIADSYDAMTSYRPYKEKKNHLEALAELIAGKGTQFDPDLVDVFVKVHTR